MADTAVCLSTQHARFLPLLGHLEELRKRIVFSVSGVHVGFLLCWSYADRIFGLMQQPIIRALRRHGLAGGLVYLNPTEPFNLYLQVALVGGLFAASPHSFSTNCGSSSRRDCIARSGVMFCPSYLARSVSLWPEVFSATRQCTRRLSTF
jgi:hypothetical protein